MGKINGEFRDWFPFTTTLPEKISHFDQEDDMATIGGIITGDLGRIPESGEAFSLKGTNVKIIDADDTRLLSLEIEVEEKEDEITSGETV